MDLAHECKPGLVHRIFVAHPYEAVYREFIQEEDVDQFDRSSKRNPFANYKVPLELEELK
jgi:hypothetical protein